MSRSSSSLPSPAPPRVVDRRPAVLVASPTALLTKCRKKFLHYFPEGFRSATYVDWERGYKWNAHELWQKTLGRAAIRILMWKGQYEEIAKRAIGIESRTNLLFSFEKMALRDAVKSREGARAFSEGLYDFLYARGTPELKFDAWCDVVGRLPRRQTRVLTWPVVTVFGFIAQPETHIFLKPNVTRRAALAYGFDFRYQSRPNWYTYASLLSFAGKVRTDQAALKPRDMIDLQSFIWVQGSEEYE